MNTPKSTKRSSTRGSRRGTTQRGRAHIPFAVELELQQSTPSTQIPTSSQQPKSSASMSQLYSSPSLNLSSTPASSSSEPKSSSLAALDFEAIRSILSTKTKQKSNKRAYKKTSIVWQHSTQHKLKTERF